MIWNREEAQKILDGQFVLDCPSLELKPSQTHTHRQAYKGSGYLSFNENGYFDFKLYLPNSIPFEDVFESLNWKVGELIDKRFYYNLSATDLKGRNWEAKDILPNRKSGPAGAMIAGKASQLVNRNEASSISKKAYLKLMFNADLKTPMNTLVSTETQVAGQPRNRSYDMRVASFSACDIDFEIEKDSGVTILTASSDKVIFTESVLTSIVEAFHFVSGSVQPWSVFEILDKSLEEIRLQAVVSDTQRTRIGPPISLSQAGDQIWKLFEKYLSFELRNGDDASRSLGSLVRSVISSGKSSLDVEALTLSVSVESLLVNEFGASFEVDKQLENNISTVIKRLEEMPDLDDNFRERLFGTMKAMKKRRAKDFLIEFREAGLIESALIKTYEKRRNKSAHGEGVNWAKIQSFINQSATVLVLFYQLIFLRIGYTGIYTDYGSYDYPIREFTSTFVPFIASPHLTPPEQSADFGKEVIEKTPDANV